MLPSSRYWRRLCHRTHAAGSVIAVTPYVSSKTAIGIVYDIHFYARRNDLGVRIVLECIPLPNTLELIQLELTRIVQPIPAKPREMHIVTFDRPAAGGEVGATSPNSATVTPEAEKEE